jgi:hypothetical protein
VGPAAEDRRVVLAVTAYGRQAGGPGALRWRGADGATLRAWRASASQLTNVSLYFDRFKLKNFELKFKFAKYESCRPVNPLQLS